MITASFITSFSAVIVYNPIHKKYDAEEELFFKQLQLLIATVETRFVIKLIGWWWWKLSRCWNWSTLIVGMQNSCHCDVNCFSFASNRQFCRLMITSSEYILYFQDCVYFSSSVGNFWEQVRWIKITYMLFLFWGQCQYDSWFQLTFQLVFCSPQFNVQYLLSTYGNIYKI